jgi:hypothetical protein
MCVGHIQYSTHLDYYMDMDWYGHGLDMEVLPALYVLHSTIEE